MEYAQSLIMHPARPIVAIPRAAITLGVAAAIGLGLWVSLQYSLASWGADGDIFVPMVLWRGCQEHGLSFFRSWTYTQDNWLFSVVPLASAAFAVFGAKLQVALALGWASFLASVSLTAWITARLAGRTAGLAAGVVLLFASFPALGHVGYLSYPVSHNISMAWGLAAIALALLGLERNAPSLCLAASVVVFLDAVSDPWAGVGIALPMAFASGGVAVLRRVWRPGTAVLFIGCLAAYTCATTRLFGVLGFLPPGHLALADRDDLAVTLRWGSFAIASMFHVLPGLKITWPGVEALDIAAWLLVVGGVSASMARSLRHLSCGHQFVALTSILSIGAVLVPFLASRWPAEPYLGRFLPNLYFLGAILVASQTGFRWRAWSGWRRGVILLYAGLFAVAGAASRPDIWLGEARPVPDVAGARALGAFLMSHGLRYGYGPFWGAGALTMDSLTAGRVTIRPVSFQTGEIARRPVETSGFWFTQDAEPATGRVFLVIARDDEECYEPRACEAMAVRQSGTPAERLSYGTKTILVWPGPLVTKIAP